MTLLESCVTLKCLQVPDNTHTQATYMHLHARIKGICFKGRDIKREKKKHSIYSSRFIFFLSGAQWGQAPIFFHPHVNHESLFPQYTNHIVQIKGQQPHEHLRFAVRATLKHRKLLRFFSHNSLNFTVTWFLFTRQMLRKMLGSSDL